MISLKDVVCGKHITLEDATVLHRVEWEGEWFFLCSSKCSEFFRASPCEYARTLPASTSPRRVERWRDVPERV